MNIDEEVWKVVPTLEDYEASNLGRVRRTIHAEHYLKGHLMRLIDEHGYRKVAITRDGRTRKIAVHRMVVAAFTGRMEPREIHVNHINGVKHDNRLENLEWCTASENHKHAMRMGLMRPLILYGEATGHAKLTASDVIEIRRRVREGATLSSLVPVFNVSKSSIGKAASGMTWGHLCP